MAWKNGIDKLSNGNTKIAKSIRRIKRGSITAMASVENNQRAEKVIEKILEMEDNNEELTAQKLLKIMATI